MKILYAFLVAALIVFSVWTYTLIWRKPMQFNLFVERVMVKKALADPEFLSYLGITDNTLFDFTSDKLTDISQSKNNSTLQTVRDDLRVLREYRRDQLKGQEKLTYDILEHYLLDSLASASFGYGSYLNSFSFSDFTPYPVNQVFGMQNYLPNFMVNTHQIINKKSAQNYITRLSQWDKKFADLILELKLREKNGVTPPRFVIEKVLNELNRFISVPISENMLFTNFREKIKKIELSNLDKASLEKRVLEEIQTKVYPAYLELIGFLQNQKNLATLDAGVWKFPDGDKYYAHCLKYHTTTNHTPDEVHALGLSEVARIKGEMRQTLDQVGYQDQEIIQAMKELGNNPQFLYPETDEGRQQVLVDYRALLEAVKNKLPELFFYSPVGELKVEAVPDFQAQSAPMAYYEPGDLNGMRPGTFYVNTRNLKNQTKFAMPTLAYHEGLPGHHFQIALALEIKNLPTFRKIVPFTAYQEGWALYCEQLAHEHQFSSDPYSNLGRLQMELMRAVRLVVDTGIHAKRWNREQAIEYMVENTGMNPDDVTVEIERYIVLPGQACSYKIGMIKLLELREMMKQRLGSAFDIRRFHQIVLENGASPLTLLENDLLDQLK